MCKMPSKSKKSKNKLNDNEYLSHIDTFLSEKNEKKTSIEIPSYKYNAVDLINEYLKDKKCTVQTKYNHPEYDYCTIFINK